MAPRLTLSIIDRIAKGAENYILLCTLCPGGVFKVDDNADRLMMFSGLSARWYRCSNCQTTLPISEQGNFKKDQHIEGVSYEDLNAPVIRFVERTCGGSIHTASEELTKEERIAYYLKVNGIKG